MSKLRNLGHLLTGLGIIIGFGIGVLLITAAVVAVNVAWILGMVWLVKTIFF